MTDLKDRNGNLLPDDARLTKFGKCSVPHPDELPELFNILKGDMAVIGPRPLLGSSICPCSPVQRRRHEVNGPGLSGLAQIMEGMQYPGKKI